MIWIYLSLAALVCIAILGFILYRAKEPAEENKKIMEKEYYTMPKKES